MNCGSCSSRGYPKVCEACQRMRQEGEWLWEIDNTQRIIRCPVCGFGNLIGTYQYRNPYHYCPSCGRLNLAAEQISMDIKTPAP